MPQPHFEQVKTVTYWANAILFALLYPGSAPSIISLLNEALNDLRYTVTHMLSKYTDFTTMIHVQHAGI